MDMTIDIFAQQPFGKAALKTLGNIPENFRLYEAGWVGNAPNDFRIMEVKGAEFRFALRGKNKGKLTVMVPGTIKTTYVTKEEIQEFCT